MDSGKAPRPEVPRPWQPRFGIGALLLVMVVCSVTAAAASYLVRSLQAEGHTSRMPFILFTLVAPVALLVVVSLVRQLYVWFERRR